MLRRLLLALIATCSLACSGNVADAEGTRDGGDPAPDASSKVPEAGGGAGASGAGGEAGTSGAGGEAGATAAGGGDGGGVSGGVDGGLQDPDAIAVAVGYGGRRMWSPDGMSWHDLQEINPNGGDDNDLLRGVGYGDGRFVAVGGSSDGRSMISSDGASWSDDTMAAPSWIGDAVYLNGDWIAAGGNGLRVRSTDDGKTWGDEAGYEEGHFRDVVVGSGMAVAVGQTYGDGPRLGFVGTTRDGVSWTLAKGGGELHSVAFGNGVFVAAGDGGRVAYSSDAVSWTDVELEGSGRNLVFANGQFIALVLAGYAVSDNGADWTTLPDKSPKRVRAHLKGHYIAFLGASIQVSTDLQAWTVVNETDGRGFEDVAVGVPGG